MNSENLVIDTIITGILPKIKSICSNIV